MKIGIFGGAFNPIHNGHLEVGIGILMEGLVDQVWYMPCYKSMFGKKMAAPLHRLRMVELATKCHVRLMTYDFEIKYQLQTDSYTIMKKIKQDLFGHSLYFIIGQDNANKMMMWGHSELITKEVAFIVIPRSGYPMINEPWYDQPPHIFFKDAELNRPVSSTMIRKSITETYKPQELNQGVFEYINQFGLYSERYQ